MTGKTPMWRRYLTFWGRDIDSDLEDEVSFHIEARTRELVEAGWTPEAAHQEARRAFGDPDPILQECRRIDTRFEQEQRMTAYLDDLRHDVLFALRQLRRQPKFWSVIVLTLVVGIAASTSIFAIVDGVLLKPLPYPEPDRLAHVMSGTWKGVYVHLRDRTATLDPAAYSGGPEVTLGTGTAPARVRAATVSPDLFSVLGVPAALGRTFTEEEARPGSPAVTGDDGWRTFGIVVLSHGAWQTHFGGSQEIVGRDVTIDGVPHTVIGVMPPAFAFPSRDTALWLPMSIDPANTASLWSANGWTIVGRLREAQAIGMAREEVRAIVPTLRSLAPPYLPMPDGYGADAAVLPLHETIVGDVRAEMLLLLAAIGAVLLTLSLNVANLLLARGLDRRLELATRGALGASRGRLVRQSLSENLTVALLAGALGTIASFAILRVMAALLPADLPRVDRIQIDGRVLLFALGVSIATALLFGLLPAVRAARTNRLLAGTRGVVSVAGEGRITRALATLELAFAVVLAVSAGLLLRSVWNLSAVDVGFRPEGLVSARIATLDSPDPFLRDLADRMRAMPGVTAAAVGTSVPFDGDAFPIGFGIDGRPGDPNLPTVAVGVAVSPDYMRTLGMSLVEGRGFSDTDRLDGPPVAIVSEGLARAYWAGASPIGARVRLPERDAPWRTIVGVAADVRWSDLAGADPRVLYLPIAQHDVFSGLRRLVIRTADDPAAVAASLRAIVASLDPGAAVGDVRTSRTRVGEQIARPRFAAYLLAGFAALALFLAAIGVYGVLSYAMHRRVPEIGVRLAFGARGSDVFALLFGQGLAITLAGIAIGLPLAFGATRFLSGLLFGVEPVDTAVFTLVPAVLLFVGLAAA